MKTLLVALSLLVSATAFSQFNASAGLGVDMPFGTAKNPQYIYVPYVHGSYSFDNSTAFVATARIRSVEAFGANNATAFDFAIGTQFSSTRLFLRVPELGFMKINSSASATVGFAAGLFVGRGGVELRYTHGDAFDQRLRTVNVVTASFFVDMF